MTEFNTVTEGGVTASSNSETPEQISAILSEGKTEEKSDTSEAAAVLGKEGGKASAAKRSLEATEQGKAKGDAGSEGTGEAGEQRGEGVQPSGSEEAKAAEGEKPLGKPRDDPRARMLEATRQAAEAKREAQRERAERERLAAEIAALKAGKTPEQPKQAQKGPDDDPEPDLANYEGDNAYERFVKDTARWQYREAKRQDEAQARERAYHDGISQAVDSFTKRMDEAEAKDPEYNSKVAHFAAQLCPSFKAKRDGIPLSQIHVITDEIINSEIAPTLTLYLAEHDDVLQRLKALRTPSDVQFAMAKLEGRLEAEAKRSDAAPQAPALKAVPSQAKPPLRPVNGSPHTAESVPGVDASYEDHKKYWTRRDREKLAQR